MCESVCVNTPFSPDLLAPSARTRRRRVQCCLQGHLDRIWPGSASSRNRPQCLYRVNAQTQRGLSAHRKWQTTPVINSFLSEHLGVSSFTIRHREMKRRGGRQERGERTGAANERRRAVPAPPPPPINSTLRQSTQPSIVPSIDPWLINVNVGAGSCKGDKRERKGQKHCFCL